MTGSPVFSDAIAAWITRDASKPCAPLPSISAGAYPVGHLAHEGGDAVTEGIVKVPEPAEHGVGEHALLQVSRGIQRGLAPHILDDQAPPRAGHLAALHGMTALDVV